MLPRAGLLHQEGKRLFNLVQPSVNGSEIGLRFAGFRTVEAASGGEGVSQAVEHLPDVILMDIRLPDMEGTEAARQIKGDERTAHIPVVALTSLAMKGDRESFLAAGFDGYLEKPISVLELPEQVRSFCGS